MLPARFFAAVFAALLAAASMGMPPPSIGGAPTPTVRVGDAAPELSIETWVRGEPLTAIERGRVHLLVFWSSWSRASARAAEPLSELARKHGGALEVIAVNVAEPRGLAAARSFAESQRERVAFRIGYDRNGRTDRAWVWSSGWAEKEMPIYFIVDREGRIAWIGRGISRVSAIVERALAGTLDPKKQAEEDAAVEARAVEAAARSAEIRARLDAATAKGDATLALKAIDELTALDPDSEADTALMRFTLLVEAGQAVKAVEYASSVLDGLLKDDAVALNDIAWSMLTEETMPEGSVSVARKAALRASSLTKDEDSMILDTLALAHFKSGDKAKALAVQRKAVERIPPDWDEDARAELKERLAEYEQAVR